MPCPGARPTGCGAKSIAQWRPRPVAGRGRPRPTGAKERPAGRGRRRYPHEMAPARRLVSEARQAAVGMDLRRAAVSRRPRCADPRRPPRRHGGGSLICRMNFFSSDGFLRAVAAAGRAEGLLAVSSLRAGERLLAAHLGVLWERRFYYWIAAYDPELARFSPGRLLTEAMLESSYRAAIGSSTSSSEARTTSGSMPPTPASSAHLAGGLWRTPRRRSWRGRRAAPWRSGLGPSSAHGR